MLSILPARSQSFHGGASQEAIYSRAVAGEFDIISDAEAMKIAEWQLSQALTKPAEVRKIPLGRSYAWTRQVTQNYPEGSPAFKVAKSLQERVLLLANDAPKKWSATFQPQILSGKWQGQRSSFRSPGTAFARLALIQKLPESYVVELKIQRLSGSKDGNIFLRVGEGQVKFGVGLLQYAGFETGGKSDFSKQIHSTPALKDLAKLSDGTALNLELTVLKTGKKTYRLHARMNGRVAQTWHGDLAKQRFGGSWAVSPEALAIGSHESSFLFEDIRVRPAVTSDWITTLMISGRRPKTKRPLLTRLRNKSLMIGRPLSIDTTKQTVQWKPLDGAPISIPMIQFDPASTYRIYAASLEPPGPESWLNLSKKLPDPWAARACTRATTWDNKRMGAHVMCLASDKYGRLFAGTEGNGLWMLEPGKTWRQFTTRDGLGDDFIYAVAVDHQARIWVGHARHGVSVYNGASWKNYDRLTGPVGERVFDIQINPVDGEVWIATSAGIARYRDHGAIHWHYLTRSNGLPEDQVASIAFRRSGDVILGLQSQGLAIGKYSNHFTSWTRVDGPTVPAPKPRGSSTGLPFALVNDVLVSTAGWTYVATSHGVAVCRDEACEQWAYLRGKDWIAMAEGLEHPPTIRDGHRTVGGLLREDYVTTLVDTPGGVVAGYRRAGAELLPKTLQFPGVQKKRLHMQRVDAIRDLLWLPDGKLLVASYGEGLRSYGDTAQTRNDREAEAETVAHPLPARPPDASFFQTGADKFSTGSFSNLPEGMAMFFREDWATQGNWLGRHGHKFTELAATTSPLSNVYQNDTAYNVKPQIGTHYRGGDLLRAWRWQPSSEERRVVYLPCNGLRRPAGWDDHAEAYPWTFEGPDIWIRLKVPRGVNVAAIYFMNFDGQKGSNRFRDYLVEIYRQYMGTAPLARTRVKEFHQGVYKLFLLSGTGPFWVKIAKNNSFNTMVSAVMLDTWAGTHSRYEDWAVPWTGGGPAWKAKPIPATPDQPGLEFWRQMIPRRGNPAIAQAYPLLQTLAYRDAASRETSQKILADLRLRMLFWIKGDDGVYSQNIQHCWERQLRRTPGIASRQRQR